jgi:3-oxoadipate enol-lactonase
MALQKIHSAMSSLRPFAFRSPALKLTTDVVVAAAAFVALLIALSIVPTAAAAAAAAVGAGAVEAAGDAPSESAGFATVGEIRMYYEISGEGEPLLLIMGLGGHILDWGWVLPERLAEGRQVIVFDNRGAGRSDQPAGPYSIAEMANDTIGLLDALGIERADVFGVSMGGMIAQEMAVNRPDRINKLILGATSPGGDSQVLAPPEVQAFLEPRLDLTLYEALWWGAPAGFPQEFIDAHPEIVERKVQANMAYPSNLEAYRAQLDAYRAFDIGDRISEICAPTLVIAGDSDILIPPENGRILAEKIPGAEFCEIEGAGHLFWISHPNETYSAVAGFLEGRGGKENIIKLT